MSEIKVSLGGTSTAPYDTYENAFADIQSAIDYASNGDTVNIDDGTYVISTTISVSKRVSILLVGMGLGGINYRWQWRLWVL